MTGLVAIAIQELPGIISMIQGAFLSQNPHQPLPSDEAIMAALEESFRSSLAKDDQWLAAHPADE